MTVKIYALFYEELREIKGEKFNCVIFFFTPGNSLWTMWQQHYTLVMRQLS